MEKGRGLYAHNVSAPHINAVKRWDERNRRETKGSSVDQLAVSKSVEEQTIFMEAVLLVIKHLVGNGQPRRGHTKSTDFKNEDVSGGFFLETLTNIVFPLRPDIAEAAKHLPGNAKCTSPDVQNEVVTIVTAGCIKNKIAQEVRNAEIFTVSADGTSDSDGNEISPLFLGMCAKMIYRLRSMLFRSRS